jgi:hypothetical protein
MIARTNPLELLGSGIDLHLSQAPTDARNLTFTDQTELEQMFTLIQRSFSQLIDEFSHPSLMITIGQPVTLSTGQDEWRYLSSDISQRNIGGEHTGSMFKFTTTFTGKEVILPNTTLIVAAIRFKFFYWIWYRHVCNPKEMQGSFKANPRFTKGFFTLKARISNETPKIEDISRELLKRATEDILLWAQQLGEFVDGRLKLLREVGPIIE